MAGEDERVPIEHRKTTLCADRICMRLNFKILYYSGFWPISPGEARNVSYFWRYSYPRVLIGRYVFGIVSHVLASRMVWADASNALMEEIVCVGLYIIFLNKQATMFYYRNSIANIFATFENLNDPSKMINEDHVKIRKDTETLSNKFTKYFFFGLAVVSIIVIIILLYQTLKLTGSVRVIPFKRWFPYNYTQSPLFEVTATVALTTALLEIMIVATCDTVLIASLLQIVSQFKILRYNLENIRRIVANLTLDNVLQLNGDQRKGQMVIPRVDGSESSGNVGPISVAFLPRTVETRDSSCITIISEDQFEGAATVNLGTEEELDFVIGDKHYLEPTSHIQQDAGSIAEKSRREKYEKIKLDYKLELFLSYCVKHHYTLIAASKELQRIFKQMLLFQMLLHALVSMMTLIIRNMDTDPTITAMAIMAAAWVLVEFLVYCVFANDLTDESLLVRQAAYACDWFEATESFKRSIRIIISRANKPIFVRAAGIPLSMSTYRVVIRIVYYSQMMLAKLINGEKIIKRVE